mmetsp:Transcript_2285/g.6926  ORF Transcript_2285/g.6926 Transcript_2285/m.6926 type:complete len:246 (+) Transcript_2285:416-1153(+)
MRRRGGGSSEWRRYDCGPAGVPAGVPAERVLCALVGGSVLVGQPHLRRAPRVPAGQRMDQGRAAGAALHPHDHCLCVGMQGPAQRPQPRARGGAGARGARHARAGRARRDRRAGGVAAALLPRRAARSHERGVAARGWHDPPVGGHAHLRLPRPRVPLRRAREGHRRRDPGQGDGAALVVRQLPLPARGHLFRRGAARVGERCRMVHARHLHRRLHCHPHPHGAGRCARGSIRGRHHRPPARQVL